MKLYVDEAGYTGEDLLNKDQPLFVLASTNVDTERANALIGILNQRSKADEIKFRKLAKYPNGQRNILEFLEKIAGDKDHFGFWLAHKELLLITYLIDWWVEPVLYKDGIDFYHRGANIGFENLTYCCLKSLWSQKQVRGNLQRFQEMMRSRTKKAYSAFWYELLRDYHASNDTVRQILDFLFVGERRLGYPHLKGIPERCMDISLSGLLVMVLGWRKRTEDSLKIVCDASSQMAREKWVWDAIVAPNVPSKIVGYDRRKMQFPVGVQETALENSRRSPQLQIADVVAGIMDTVCKASAEKRFRTKFALELREKVRQCQINRFAMGGIWPDTAVTPEELETTEDDAEDGNMFLGELIWKATPKTPETEHKD